MSAEIKVEEFRYIPGQNDVEYINLLLKNLNRQRIIISKAIAKIKELSKQTKFKWIPCSAKLPEAHTHVLISDKNECVDIGLYYPEYNYWTLLEDDYIMTNQIVAWMPLPEPYRVLEIIDE